MLRLEKSKNRTIPGLEKVQKKPTYKERIKKEKTIKTGFKKIRKYIGIGQYIYYPTIVNILISGKIKVKYDENDEYIH